MREAVLGWLGAFLFTQAVEVPIWAYALRNHRAHARSEARFSLATAMLVAFGASAITHPFVWFAFPRLSSSSYWVMVAQAESFAVLTEAAYMAFFGLRWALAWSLLANAASAALGLLSRYAFGWP